MKTPLILDSAYELWCPVCKEITLFEEYLDRPGGNRTGVICIQCKTNRQMQAPPDYECHPYKEQCKCGKEHLLLTQEDRSPEYYTSVGVVCDCKEIVWFSLPVN